MLLEILLCEYWWVFILVIFVIMIVYPTPVKKRKNFNKKKKLDFNAVPVLTNLNKLTAYLVI